MKKPVRTFSRPIIRCAVFLVVACLVADMAMPFFPGAFRLDPNESIEATASRTATSGVAAPAQLFVRCDPRVLAIHGARCNRGAKGFSRGWPQLRLYSPLPLRAFPPNESANSSEDA